MVAHTYTHSYDSSHLLCVSERYIRSSPRLDTRIIPPPKKFGFIHPTNTMGVVVSVAYNVTCLLTAHAALAVIFTHLPPLPWTRRRRGTFQPAHRGAFAIAHRGGSLIAPENTLLAFRRALRDARSDMLELDVCETRDGVVVVTHDDDLSRQCGCAVKVSETNFADLPRLGTTIVNHFPAPQHKSVYVMSDADVAAHGAQPFCTLRDVFEAFPDALLHVDAKYTSPSTVDKVVALVREFHREDRTVVGGGGDPNSKRFRAAAVADPSRPLFTFASARQVGLTYLAYYLGVLPYLPVWFDVFDIPLPTPLLVERLVGSVSGKVPQALLPRLLYAPGLWRMLQRRGVRVFGFVLNTEACFAHVKAWPVDGIMTDDPVALRRWYDAARQ